MSILKIVGLQIYNKIMPKKPQAPSPRHKLSSYKKFWLIFASGIIVIIGILLGSSLYETYHNRPLTKGLDYVGRQYNSGCLPFRILCTGPETEFLFYATDVKPENVGDLFPGWKIESKQDSLWYLPKTQVENVLFSLTSPKDTQLKAGYYYFPDKKLPTQELNLLPNSKSYIIMIDREEYNVLSQAGSN